MFHMLSCFDLKPEFTLEDYQQSLDAYTDHMRDLGLVEERGPIGEHHNDTI